MNKPRTKSFKVLCKKGALQTGFEKISNDNLAIKHQMHKIQKDGFVSKQFNTTKILVYTF